MNRLEIDVLRILAGPIVEGPKDTRDAPFPAMTPGVHQLALIASQAVPGMPQPIESLPSASLSVQLYVWPAVPANLRIGG